MLKGKKNYLDSIEKKVVHACINLVMHILIISIIYFYNVECSRTGEMRTDRQADVEKTSHTYEQIYISRLNSSYFKNVYGSATARILI